ncbi:unnamed protein product [Miscanthus lutarioriparius]|uniref:FBD domain-containing protein n=1 Tax=Miscanthus lutarioriparius TaxID=422564 RepID=A0A811Q1Q7_9POAL|nr:unnamed protein product [Miscanthus lutarioriparius]
MDCITTRGLAFIDKASRDELLGGLSFSLLEQLELEVEYKPGFEPSIVMLLADLLHCFPMVCDLRIKFVKKHQTPWIESSIENEPGVQFDKSVSGFRNRKSRSMVSLGTENEDNYQDYGVTPGLTTEQSFSCLQSHLKRVSLHFSMDEPNCLGVKLAKFFAENAMVLQELHIDVGCHEMLEHVNSSVRRWIANTDITAITS